MFRKMRDHLSSVWNKFDMLLYSLAIASFVLRQFTQTFQVKLYIYLSLFIYIYICITYSLSCPRYANLIFIPLISLLLGHPDMCTSKHTVITNNYLKSYSVEFPYLENYTTI